MFFLNSLSCCLILSPTFWSDTSSFYYARGTMLIDGKWGGFNSCDTDRLLLNSHTGLIAENYVVGYYSGYRSWFLMRQVSFSCILSDISYCCYLILNRLFIISCISFYMPLPYYKTYFFISFITSMLGSSFWFVSSLFTVNRITENSF